MTTPAAAPAKTATKYHIFREIDSAGVKTYEPVDANVEAANGAAAIKKTAKENGVYSTSTTRPTPTSETRSSTTSRFSARTATRASTGRRHERRSHRDR